jgi:hypothetical protein
VTADYHGEVQDNDPGWSPIFLKLVDDVYERYPQFHSAYDWETRVDHPHIADQRYEVLLPPVSNSQKHQLQVQALVDLMADQGLLSATMRPGCNNAPLALTTMMEFGAGRAQLSAELASKLAADHRPSVEFVLIDRQPVRHKQDPRHAFPCRRVLIDIKDLCLDELLMTGQSSDTSLIAYGKHLCGAATDLTINCLAGAHGVQIKGLVIALCCHHRSSYQEYCNHEFLVNNGIGPAEFDRLCRLSSWATCGGRNDGRLYRAYGVKCKRILDIGRLLLLHRMGHSDARLVRYASSNVTPENLAIVLSE